MNQNSKRFLLIVTFLGILGFLAWYFFYVLIWFMIALVFTVLGSPLFRLISKIKIGKKQIPSSLNAFLTLLTMFTIIISFFYFSFPVLVRQLNALSAIDPQLFTTALEQNMQPVEELLICHGLVNEDFNINELILSKFQEFKAHLDFKAIFSFLTGFITNIGIGIICVIFITFFSLKDKNIIFDTLLKFIPISLRSSFKTIIDESKKSLVRYFGGLITEMFLVGALYVIICSLFGVPNALIIAFLFGILLIIPYVGALIALILSLVLGIAGTIGVTPDSAEISLVVLKIVGIYAFITMIDMLLLQPTIYSKSVKTHPLEIFLLILISGRLWGIVGMMIAIPTYTIIRIVVREFFGQYFIHNQNETDNLRA